jgi:hypothetical protein
MRKVGATAGSKSDSGKYEWQLRNKHGLKLLLLLLELIVNWQVPTTVVTSLMFTGYEEGVDVVW